MKQTKTKRCARLCAFSMPFPFVNPFRTAALFICNGAARASYDFLPVVTCLCFIHALLPFIAPPNMPNVH